MSRLVRVLDGCVGDLEDVLHDLAKGDADKVRLLVPLHVGGHAVALDLASAEIDLHESCPGKRLFGDEIKIYALRR